MPETPDVPTFDKAFIEDKYSVDDIMRYGREALPRKQSAEAIIDARNLIAEETSYRGFLNHVANTLEASLTSIKHHSGQRVMLDTPVQSLYVHFDPEDNLFIVDSTFRINHSDADIYCAGIEYLVAREERRQRIDLRAEAQAKLDQESKDRLDRSNLEQLIQKFPEEAARILERNSQS